MFKEAQTHANKKRKLLRIPIDEIPKSSEEEKLEQEIWRVMNEETVGQYREWSAIPKIKKETLFQQQNPLTEEEIKSIQEMIFRATSIQTRTLLTILQSHEKFLSKSMLCDFVPGDRVEWMQTPNKQIPNGGRVKGTVVKAGTCKLKIDVDSIYSNSKKPIRMDPRNVTLLQPVTMYNVKTVVTMLDGQKRAWTGLYSTPTPMAILPPDAIQDSVQYQVLSTEVHELPKPVEIQ